MSIRLRRPGRGHEGPGPVLPILALFAETARIWAGHWRVLIPISVVVLAPQAIADAIDLGIDTADFDLGRAAVVLLGVGGLTAISLAGEALYAGLITRLVIGWRGGGAPPGLVELARTLPIARLVVADLLVTLGTAFGLLLLVVPGVAFATYFLVTTVMIELEGHSIGSGMRRSASLVHGSFWRVLVITVIVVGGSEALSAALQAPFHGFAHELGVNLAVDALVEPPQGVAIVLVALGLMELRGERPRPDESGRRAGEGE